MKRLAVVFSLLLALLSTAGFWGPFKEKEKYAIILLADTDTHEGLTRADQAILYAIELKEAGYDVKLIFEGAGTKWAEQLTRSDGKSPLIPQFRELNKLGVKVEACDFCSETFDVKTALRQRKFKLVGEYKGHPSIVTLSKKGYRILVL